MRIERHEVHWIESRTDYATHELVELSGLTQAELLELIDRGVLPTQGGTSFEAQAVSLVRIARRLRDDFELDAHGVAVALTLIRRVRALEEEVARLRAGA